MSSLPPTLKQRFFDSNGAPLVGGKLFSYQAGTATPLVTFTDQSELTANTNPIILDANGECDVWISDTSVYKFVLTDANGIVQWTVDNVLIGTGSGGGGTGITALTGDIAALGTGSVSATINTGAVSNSKMAQMATNRIKGNVSGATAAPSDLTVAQVTAMLNTVVGDSGSGGTKGLVPAPASGDTASGKFLKADGTWSVPPGSGGGGSGSVTTVSVVSANGLAGTVANATTTPALTLSTSVTGLLKGNGTAIGAAASSDLPTIALTGDVTGSASGGSIATAIGTNKVANTQLGQMPANTIKGNNTAGTANAADLTVAQTTAMLNAVVGDAGSGGTKGLVPAPAAGDTAAGKYLKADGTWSAPSGTGSVTSVSVVSANGLAGTVANATSTPAITLSTSVTGLLKGNGTAIGAAASSDLPTIALTGDVTGSASGGSIATAIGTNKVANTQLAQMATNTLKGNNTGATANALDLTATQVTAMLNAMVGDSGSGGTQGLVPVPASGTAAAGKFLKADGTWAVPTGGAVVTTPTASTNAAWDSNKNLAANNFLALTTTTATAAGTTTLTAASTYNQVFTGTSDQIVVLPTCTTVPVGYSLAINNTSTGYLTIQDSNSFVWVTVAPNDVVRLLSRNSSSNDWQIIYDHCYPATVFDKNYITNPGIDTASGAGWNLGNTTLTNNFPSGTLTLGSTLGTGVVSGQVFSGGMTGIGAYSWGASGATTAGNFITSPVMRVDNAALAKVLTFKFTYKVNSGAANVNMSGTSSNSFGVAIYSVTDAAWIQPAGCFGMVQSSGIGVCTGTFQTTTTSSQYRLIIYNANATAGAATIYVDDFYVGMQTVPIGVPASDPVSYTPTFTGLGTPTGVTFTWSRLANKMFVKGVLTTGTTSGVTVTMSLPNGLTTLAASYPSNTNVGTFAYGNASAALPSLAFVLANGASNTVSFGFRDGSDSSLTSALGTALVGSTTTVSIEFVVDITGWSSNVQMSSDSSTQVVAASLGGVPTGGLTSSLTAVTFPTVNKDASGSYSGSTYTVPVTGWYNVECLLNTQGTYALNTANQIAIFKNGVQLKSIQTNAHGAVGLMPENINSIDYYNAGDLITIQHATAATSPSYRAAATENWLSIQRASGPAVVAASESVNMRATNTAGTTLSTTAGTPTVIPWVKDFDSHSALSGTTWTAPVSGKYLISASYITAAVTLTTAQSLYLTIAKNGTAASNFFLSGTGGTRTFSISGTTILSLLAGDAITVTAVSEAATTLNTTANNNQLSITRVGN